MNNSINVPNQLSNRYSDDGQTENSYNMDTKMNLKSKTLDARSWQQAEFEDDKGLAISKERSALKK